MRIELSLIPWNLFLLRLGFNQFSQSSNLFLSSFSLHFISIVNKGELQTSTTLTITLKQVHNGASLICVAENAKISNSAISDQIKLDVQCKYCYCCYCHSDAGITMCNLKSIYFKFIQI